MRLVFHAATVFIVYASMDSHFCSLQQVESNVRLVRACLYGVTAGLVDRFEAVAIELFASNRGEGQWSTKVSAMAFSACFGEALWLGRGCMRQAKRSGCLSRLLDAASSLCDDSG
eukprot:s4000_g10.t1